MRLAFTGNDEARQVVEAIGALLRPAGFPPVVRGGGGADIGPIAQLGGTPQMALLGDGERYFVIHHTPADTVERIAPGEVSKAAAGIAAMVWVIADMEERLGGRAGTLM
jgi:carboxypeptidase Q